MNSTAPTHILDAQTDPPQDTRPALRINDAAAMYGLSRSSVYKLLATGKIRSAVIGGRRLVLAEDLRKLLQDSVVTAPWGSAPLHSNSDNRAEVAEAAIADIGASISTAIGSNRWLDLPDGGDVSLAEQVTRMREALESAETELARLRSTTDLVSDKRVGEALDRSRTP